MLRVATDEERVSQCYYVERSSISYQRLGKIYLSHPQSSMNIESGHLKISLNFAQEFWTYCLHSNIERN
jgi:hypothetical protein